VGRQVKHVAVDLDDVTVDFMPGVAHSYELEFGEPLDISGGTWSRPLTTLDTPALKDAGYKSLWAWLRDREWLWALFPAVEGAIGGIATLRARGLYVEAVTSKPLWAEHNVWKWLGKWRPAFQRVTVVNTGQSKLDFTDADLIIDDKLETCIEFVEAGRQAIWFDRHDVQGPPPNGVWRARDWRGVITNVNHITGRTG